MLSSQSYLSWQQKFLIDLAVKKFRGNNHLLKSMSCFIPTQRKGSSPKRNIKCDLLTFLHEDYLKTKIFCSNIFFALTLSKTLVHQSLIING